VWGRGQASEPGDLSELTILQGDNTLLGDAVEVQCDSSRVINGEVLCQH
jgi:hypothetical protein